MLPSPPPQPVVQTSTEWREVLREVAFRIQGVEDGDRDGCQQPHFPSEFISAFDWQPGYPSLGNEMKKLGKSQIARMNSEAARYVFTLL